MSCPHCREKDYAIGRLSRLVDTMQAEILKQQAEMTDLRQSRPIKPTSVSIGPDGNHERKRP